MTVQNSLIITEKEVDVFMDVVNKCNKIGVLPDQIAYALKERENAVWADETEEIVHIIYMD